MVNPASGDGRTRLRILALRVRLLHPQNTGGTIRTAKTLEQLSKEHDVTLVAYRYPENTDEDVRRTADLCGRLVTVPFRETPKRTARFYGELARALFTPLPYTVAKYAGTDMARTVAEVYRDERPDLVLVDFVHACEGLLSLRAVPFVLFQHNVEAAIIEQLARRAPSPISRCYLGLQARRMRAYERSCCRRARHIIAVSDEDRAAYAHRYGARDCDAIPTGVDIDYFRPSDRAPRPHHLAFTGSMDWLANQDTIRHFVADILPLIRRDVPQATFSIVGRNPPKEIVRLAEDPGIAVTGTVPDIRPYVHDAGVYVVPLRIGSGTRMKLLEAMAMGKAIVSTTLGAEGLPAAHDHDIVLADGPHEFAREVVSLIRDPERRARLGANARRTAERDHSWPRVGRIFSDICVRIAGELKEEAAP